MSTNIDERSSNDNALESSEDVSSSLFQADEDHIESAPYNDSFLGEKITRKTNEATWHLAIYNQAWRKIRGLEGHTERVTSSSDDSITWTVVSQVTDDELKEARERDHILFQSNDFPILHNMTYEEKWMWFQNRIMEVMAWFDWWWYWNNQQFHNRQKHKAKRKMSVTNKEDK